MEAALDVLARRVAIDIDGDAAGAPATRRFPFDPRRRRMSVVAGGLVMVKGAPDAVFPCSVVPEGAPEALHALASRGLRVLAIASRPVGPTEPSAASDAERDLELLGLVGLEDPPAPASRKRSARAVGRASASRW